MQFPFRIELALDDLSTLYAFAIQLNLDSCLINASAIALFLGPVSRICRLQHDFALAPVYAILKSRREDSKRCASGWINVVCALHQVAVTAEQGSELRLCGENAEPRDHNSGRPARPN